MALRVRGSLMPLYGEGSNKRSIKFFVGGKFIRTPEAMYQGGRAIIFDDVEVEDLSLYYLDRLCESCGLVGFMKYYMKQTVGFTLLMSDATLYKLCNDNHPTTEVELYIEQDLSRINESQVGSSNIVPRVDENNSDSSDSDNEDENVDGSGSDDSEYSFDDADYDMIEDDAKSASNEVPRKGYTKSVLSKVPTKGYTKSQLQQRKSEFGQAYQARKKLKCQDGEIYITCSEGALPPPSS